MLSDQDQTKKYCEGCSESGFCQIRGYLVVTKQYRLISECPCSICLVKLNVCKNGCGDYSNFVLRCSSDKRLNKVEMAKLLLKIFNKEYHG